MKTQILCAVMLSVSSFLYSQKPVNLIDYFLPIEPQAPLVSEGIWGKENVLPRDTANGLEDTKMQNYCYWDGRIVKDDQGRYHMYASQWNQSDPHHIGWTKSSKGMHAVSDHVMGPYVNKGLLWPYWNEGKGHNVIGLRMHDGRYATVTSEISRGEVFVSDSPDGPFELLGAIQVDNNGFDPGLARYNGGKGNMANVKILLRPDRNYMIIARTTAPMLSESGILGPYKIMGTRVYDQYPELPQSKMEDPSIWYSGGLYHIVVNHWPTKVTYHFTSHDGIHNWVYRGIAFKRDAMIFKYTDGTVNNWEFIERPTAYVENGHVTHFIFSVIDVHKGKDLGDDNHGSKIIVVPFDGIKFDKDMNQLIKAELKKK